MDTIISLLFAAATVSAVQVGFGPQATSYIYRSDNNGPPNFIHLANHDDISALPPVPLVVQHEQQPLLRPVPVPLPYVIGKPLPVIENQHSIESSEELDGVDDELETEYEKGDGGDYEEEHSSEQGEKDVKGYNSKGHEAKGVTGHYHKGHRSGDFSESKGENSAHHDEADAHGKHYESGKNYKGGDHGHKKYFSKGEDVTGYHKVFHKDEFKKDHDFYDVADNSGHFNKHGYEKGQHGSEEGAHKSGGHHDAGYDKKQSANGGFIDKGYVDEEEIDHSNEEGEDSHYNHKQDYGKKGESRHEKDFAYGNDNGDDIHESYD